MFNSDIIAIVTQETCLLATELERDTTAGVHLPDLLYYAADATALSHLVAERALRATYSTDPDLDARRSYGLTLLHDFLKARTVDTRGDLQRRQFAEAALQHLDPLSSVFAGFHVRFSEHADPTHSVVPHHPGYAIGFDPRFMDLRVGSAGPPASMAIGKAIYAHDEQEQILGRYYDAYERYYLNAVHRFAAHNAPSYLGRCWGMLYESLSMPLALFRPPAQAAEREWLGTALDRRPDEQRNNATIHVALQENTFVPYVHVTLSKRDDTRKSAMPIREVVLPTPQHRMQVHGLRAFLNLSGIATVSVRCAVDHALGAAHPSVHQ